MRHLPTRLTSCRLSLGGVLAVLSFTMGAQAQTLPDSGRVLKELRTPPPPATQPTDELEIQQPQISAVAPGGVTTTVTNIKLVGNTVFTSDRLLAVLGNVQGQSFDLAQLQGLAARITDYYHQHDYSFTLAYLPPQTLKDGELTIGVVEGRYGLVELSGDAALTQGLTDLISPLQSGDMIAGTLLSRTARLLNRLPGVEVTSVLRPGDNTGEGDLTMDVTAAPRYQASIRADNHGNRYSGDWRTLVNVKVNRLLTVGDELTLDAMATDESLWYGGLRYQLPLGGSGLRGNVEYQQTDYQLGEELSALGARGAARIAKLGLSYPLVLQRSSELNLALTMAHSELDDRYNTTLPTYSKASESVLLELNGHHFNRMAKGGLTQGRVAWLGGELQLDDALIPFDSLTAETDGSYQLAQLEVSHQQTLWEDISLFAYIDSQWTEENLDSSEGFGLGGASGVRAYPSGEAYGDRGWLGQFEVRYQWQSLAPYVFYDLGEVTTNAEPWEPSDNHRSLAGAGIGARLNYLKLSVDASAAWRVSGGDPQSDTEADSPTVWISVSYELR